MAKKNSTKTVPELRFRGFTDPWEQRQTSDQFVAVKETRHADLPVLSATQNEGMVYRDDLDIDIKFKQDALDAYKLVRPGDFVISLRSFQGGFELSDKTGIVSPAYTVFTHAESSGQDNRYWKQYFKRKAFIESLKTVTFGIRDGKAISFSDFSSLRCISPSLPEQHRIGEFFSTLDSLIAAAERQEALLRQKKRAYLQLMFPQEGETEPHLRFAGFSGQWQRQQLGEVGLTYPGLSGKTKEDFGHGDARFVTYMNVYSNAVANPDGVEAIEKDDRQHEVMNGDVFFTGSSETPDEVGLSSVWLGNSTDTYLNSFCFGYRPSKQLDPLFLASSLRSPQMRSRIVLLAQGISRFNISKTQVMQLPLCFPSLPEQRRIGDFFSALDNLIAATKQRTESFRALKSAYLQRMFV